MCGDQSPALLQPSPGRVPGQVCPCPAVQPGSGSSQTQLGIPERFTEMLHSHLNVHLIMTGSE